MPRLKIVPSEKRDLGGMPLAFRDGLMVSGAVYFILAALIYPEPLLQRSLAFGLIFSLIFLSFTPGGSRSGSAPQLTDWILVLLSVGVSLYVGLNLERLLNRIVFYDQVLMSDKVMGVIALLVMIEGTRRVVGPWLPLLSLLALGYFALGQFAPENFAHQGFTFDYMVDGIFLSGHGLWGTTFGIATGHIMIFLIFGAFFLKSGAGDFLFDFAASFAGKSRGGIAKIAVVSSALFGMITGGPISNVSTTGSITIPAMIKKGYSREFAAATESCASVGGAFMPPVMGSVVFIMSEVVGIPYSTIALRALLPALVYFTAIFFVVEARSRKYGIMGFAEEERKPWLALIQRGATFFIPLLYLTFRLLQGITPGRIGLETIVVIVAMSLRNEDHLLSSRKIADIFIRAMDRGMVIIATMATCSVMVGVVNITGVSMKFSSYLMSVEDYSIGLTLFLVMALTIFMGLAMSGSSAYLITAVMCAPVLIEYGFDPLSVHLFILYFSVTASITPPVALTSFIAASIAGAEPLRVGFMAMRMALVSFILPYMFVFNPGILLVGKPMAIIVAFIASLFGVAMLASGTEGWWLDEGLSLPMRLLLIILGIMGLSGYLPAALPAVLITGGLYFNKRLRRGKIIQIEE